MLTLVLMLTEETWLVVGGDSSFIGEPFEPIDDPVSNYSFRSDFSEHLRKSSCIFTVYCILLESEFLAYFCIRYENKKIC